MRQTCIWDRKTASLNRKSSIWLQIPEYFTTILWKHTQSIPLFRVTILDFSLFFVALGSIQWSCKSVHYIACIMKPGYSTTSRHDESVEKAMVVTLLMLIMVLLSSIRIDESCHLPWSIDIYFVYYLHGTPRTWLKHEIRWSIFTPAIIRTLIWWYIFVAGVVKTMQIIWFIMIPTNR